MIDKISIAISYYTSMLAKDFERMATYLHDEVWFISPFGEMRTKEGVIEAAKGLTLDDIEFRSHFESDNQVMLVYDWIFPAPIGTLRAAVLMEFTDHLISKIELFYDPRQFLGS